TPDTRFIAVAKTHPGTVGASCHGYSFQVFDVPSRQALWGGKSDDSLKPDSPLCDDLESVGLSADGAVVLVNHKRTAARIFEQSQGGTGVLVPGTAGAAARDSTLLSPDGKFLYVGGGMGGAILAVPSLQPATGFGSGNVKVQGGAEPAFDSGQSPAV